MIRQTIDCAEIKFARRKLRSVIYNLLSNAIKYTPSDRSPEIEISCLQEKEYMVIRVSDNGIGMSKEEQQCIFEKFQRVRTNYGGSGVGLYLVNTMVTAAGGKIEIESEPGRGSVFSIYLNLNQVNAACIS